MRKLIVALVVVIAGAVGLYLILRGDTAPTTKERSTGSAAISGPSSPTLGKSALASGPESLKKFQERKAPALAHLRDDLEHRILECEALGSGSRPAALRRVQLTLELDPTLSTPELQRFIVSDAEVADGNALSDEGRKCLERFDGMSLNVLLPQNELPLQLLTETISLPLR